MSHIVLPVMKNSNSLFETFCIYSAEITNDIQGNDRACHSEIYSGQFFYILLNIIRMIAQMGLFSHTVLQLYHSMLIWLIH